MPRNGSGSYTLPQAAFTPNTTISSAAVNSDFSDIASALTDSVAADGQTAMTGPLLAAEGNAASPSITFAAQKAQGFYDGGAGTINVSVGGTLVGQVNSGGFANSAGTNYLTTVTPPPQIFPQNYLTGYTMSNDVSNPHTTLDFAIGQAADSTNTQFITLSTAIGKNTSSTWASGTGGGAMGTGLTIANSTWYHVFAITNTNATWNTANTDIYFDTSVTAANKPSGTTFFRRLGSFKTNSSAQLFTFTQNGDFFNIIGGNEISSSTQRSFSTLTLLNAPTGVVVTPLINLLIQVVGGNVAQVLSSVALNTPTQYTNVAAQASENGNQIWTGYTVQTNTSAQIMYGTQGSFTGGLAHELNILGWLDTRGK